MYEETAPEGITLALIREEDHLRKEGRLFMPSQNDGVGGGWLCTREGGECRRSKRTWREIEGGQFEKKGESFQYFYIRRRPDNLQA